MNIFKFDLMTVLFFVVIIGVLVTMSTQASNRTSLDSEMVKASSQAVSSQMVSGTSLTKVN